MQDYSKKNKLSLIQELYCNLFITCYISYKNDRERVKKLDDKY